MKKENMIYDFFENYGKFIIKIRWVVIVAISLVAAGVSFGTLSLKLTSNVADWFSKKSIVNRNKEEFEKQFKNSEFVGLLVKADDVFSYEALSMIDELGNEIKNEVPLIDEVISLTEAEYSYGDEDMIYIDDLIPDEIPRSKEELEKIRKQVMSKEYFKNRIVSEDSKEAWIYIRLLTYPSQEEWERRHERDPDSVIGSKVLEIINRDKYKKYTILPTGNPILLEEELILTNNETTWMLQALVVISIVFLIIFLRSFRGVVLPFLCMIVSLIIVFGMMGYLRIDINAFLVTVPVYLTVAVAIGYSIHIFNYFNREFKRTGKRKESVISAVRQSGYPILFTALTTIGAMLSFLAVGLIPLRWLGLTCAASIFTIYIILFTLVPSVLSIGKDKNISIKAETHRESWVDTCFEKMCGWTLNHKTLIVVVFALFVVTFLAGLTMFKVNFNTEKSYGKRVPYITRMRDIGKAKVGAFSSYNITIDFQKSDAAKDPDNLRKFETFIDKIEGLKLTRRTNSILQYLKDMNKLLNEGKDEFYTIPDSRELVSQELFLYEISGGEELFEWVNDDYSLLRLQVDTKDLDSVETMNEIELIDGYCDELFPGARHNITGAMLEYAVLNQFVAKGQVITFLMALAVISVLMMIIFKSVKAGLIGLLPNITPAIVIGGLMGYLHTPLDFITMTIIPMILGIAVDDTIHFISHMDYEIKNNKTYNEASIITMKIVGKALFMTTFIIVVSFIAFAFSKYNFLKNLGIFLCIGLTIALVTDYFLTPLLIDIFKPFGKEKSES